MSFAPNELRWYVVEYFKRPFIWWGLSLKIIVIFHEVFPPFDQFITLLWVNNYHWVFFIPAFILDSRLAIDPVRRGMRFLVRQPRNRNCALILGIGLAVATVAEIPAYYSEIVALIGHQHDEAIKDHNTFNNLESILFFLTFVFIPATSIYLHRQIHRFFITNNLQTESINFERFIPFLWMLFICLLISLHILNYWIFKTLTCD